MMIMDQFRQLRRWYREIWCADNVTGQKLDFFTKLKYCRLGFTESNYFLYHLDRNDYRKFISHAERLRLEGINGRYAPFLAMKVLFEREFGGIINVPRIYAWINQGKIYDIQGESAGSEAFILDILREQGALIAKPTQNSGFGVGVVLLTCNEGSFRFANEACTDAELLKKIQALPDEYILVQRIRTGGIAREIFPWSANPIRIITVFEEGKVRPLTALMRFGTKKTMPVEDTKADNLVSIVDIETGELRPAKTWSGTSFSIHPDTGVQIEGNRVSQWHQILEQLQFAHSRFPFYHFFAWDVVLGEDGEIYILEINRGSDIQMLQLDVPQRDQLLGQYMRSQGLLDPW